MEQKLAAAEEKKTPPVSRGERIFDWLTYGGIAGVAVFIAGIPFTYWAKYGKGANVFNRASEKLIGLGFSKQGAEHVMINTALMQPGNAAVLPVKWAEDNKAALITKINDMLGEETDAAALAAEDKQSWKSILTARASGWLAVFVSLKGACHIFGENKFSAFEEKFSHAVCKPLGYATHVNGQETKAFRCGKIAAIDLFATAAASILLYTGSRMIAHWDRVRQERAEAAHAEPPNTVAKILADKAGGTTFTQSIEAGRTGETLQLGA